MAIMLLSIGEQRYASKYATKFDLQRVQSETQIQVFHRPGPMLSASRVLRVAIRTESDEKFQSQPKTMPTGV